MRIALAQVNPLVGDLEGNVERCLDAIRAAQRQGAELIVLPEMALPGCPPRDILCDPTFVEAVGAATADLARRAGSAPPAVVGTVVPSLPSAPASAHARAGHPGLHNAAVLIECGTARVVAAERLLLIHDVYMEPRWFLPGAALPPVTVAGHRVGVLLGEDLWDVDVQVHPPADLVAAGAELLVCLAASPFRHGIQEQRLHHARRAACPVAWANLCGGQDELVYDGRSFALDARGTLLARLRGFDEETRVVDMAALCPAEDAGWASADEPPERLLYQALVLGVRDFFRKNRLARATLGLSGGIDSALVACIASDALGPDRVTAVAIPSRFTDPRSTQCAQKLAASLGIGFAVVELERLHTAAEATLGALLEGGTSAENAQARLRAVILMAFVNRYGGLLLNTSNKTELALGYGTLYGDLAGSLCPIGDVTKPEVVRLASWINAERGIIPIFVLERPPSAELKPDQVDPFDYDKKAPEMECLVRENQSDQAMRRSEHKRRQAGVILKVTEKAFGSGRLIPITRK